MRGFVLIVYVFFCLTLSIAQETDRSTTKDKLGFYIPLFGNPEILQNFYYESHYQTKRLNIFGINYIHPLNKTIDFETGLEYSRFSTMIYPFALPDANYGGNSYNNNNTGELNIINLPITTRINIWKYFYLNGGLFLNLDLSKSSNIDIQTGVGTMIGVGCKYDFKSGWEILFNPYYKVYSVLSISKSYSQRILDAGCRLGVMIPLNK